MGIIADRSRWVNWDCLAVGEDFWDMLEEIDQTRLGEIREQRQMEGIRRRFESRLQHKISKKFICDGVATEPYGHMVKLPE